GVGEDLGRGLLRFIVVGFDVGDAGVVVDDGMQVAGPDQRVVVLVAGFVRRRGPVLLALLAADVAPTPAVGDLAELLHIDVDQIAWSIVFVTANRFAGGPVDMGEPVDPTADQNSVHGRGRHAEALSDLDWSEPLLPAQMHDLAN